MAGLGSFKGYTRGDAGCGRLKNIGNTCWLNAGLQCLSRIRPLAEYFLSGKHAEHLNRTTSDYKGELAVAFAELQKIFWRPERAEERHDPRAFRDVCAKLSDHSREFFQSGQQQDVSEFFCFCIDGLSEDLNRVAVKPTFKAEQREEDESRVQGRSDEFQATLSWGRYLERQKSFLIDLMQGQLQQTLTCVQCKRKTKTYDPFLYLSVPVTKKMSKVTDAIKAYTEEEEIDRLCPSCKHDKANIQQVLFTLPSVLVLLLKRMNNDGSKIHAPLEAEDVLNLTEFCGAAQSQGAMYHPVCVANHHGEFNAGHYTATCRVGDMYGGSWFHFDDEKEPMAQEEGVGPEAFVIFLVRRDTGAGDDALVVKQQTLSRLEHWPRWDTMGRPSRDVVKEIWAAEPEAKAKERREAEEAEQRRAAEAQQEQQKAEGLRAAEASRQEEVQKQRQQQQEQQEAEQRRAAEAKQEQKKAEGLQAAEANRQEEVQKQQQQQQEQEQETADGVDEVIKFDVGSEAFNAIVCALENIEFFQAMKHHHANQEVGRSIVNVSLRDFAPIQELAQMQDPGITKFLLTSIAGHAGAVGVEPPALQTKYEFKFQPIGACEASVTWRGPKQPEHMTFSSSQRPMTTLGTPEIPSTGTWYWQLIVRRSTPNTVAVGVAEGGTDRDAFLGKGGWGLLGGVGNSNIVVDGEVQQRGLLLGGLADKQAIGLLIDMDAGSLSFWAKRKNQGEKLEGDGYFERLGTPITGLKGKKLFPAYSAYGSEDCVEVKTGPTPSVEVPSGSLTVSRLMGF